MSVARQQQENFSQRNQKKGDSKTFPKLWLTLEPKKNRETPRSPAKDKKLN